MGDNGMRHCNSIPRLHEEGLQCQLDMGAYNSTDNTTCVDWNQYYTNCSAGDDNPFKGAINFDNIGYAWIAIFQVGFQEEFCIELGIIAKCFKSYLYLNHTKAGTRRNSCCLTNETRTLYTKLCLLSFTKIAVLFWHLILLSDLMGIHQ